MANCTICSQEFTLLQPNVAVSVLHPESPFDHHEGFVFVVMLVPHELALELYQLDVLPVNSPTILGCSAPQNWTGA